LLATLFDAVVMVADETSLSDSASRLHPDLAVVDISLARQNGLGWLQRLRKRCPGLKLILISSYDDPSVREAAGKCGVDGFVAKHAIPTDLLPVVEAVLGGSIQSHQVEDPPSN